MGEVYKVARELRVSTGLKVGFGEISLFPHTFSNLELTQISPSRLFARICGCLLFGFGLFAAGHAVAFLDQGVPFFAEKALVK